jgi:hypothetical protein
MSRTVTKARRRHHHYHHHHHHHIITISLRIIREIVIASGGWRQRIVKIKMMFLE